MAVSLKYHGTPAPRLQTGLERRGSGAPAVGEPHLIAVSGETGYIQLSDRSIVTGRHVGGGFYEIPSATGQAARVRPLTREDISMKARMVEELAAHFTRNLAFWAGLPSLHVPELCEPEFEATASEAEFLLLGDADASTLTSPLSRSTLWVPVHVKGYLSITALPAFQMERAEDGYNVDFGHLRPTTEGGWALHNHNFVKPSKGSTYFKIQRR